MSVYRNSFSVLTFFLSAARSFESRQEQLSVFFNCCQVWLFFRSSLLFFIRPNYQRDRAVAGGFPHQRLQLVSTLKMVLSWGAWGGGRGCRQFAASPALSIRLGACPLLTQLSVWGHFHRKSCFPSPDAVNRWSERRSDVTALNINSLCCGRRFGSASPPRRRK